MWQDVRRADRTMPERARNKRLVMRTCSYNQVISYVLFFLFACFAEQSNLDITKSCLQKKKIIILRILLSRGFGISAVKKQPSFPGHLS